MGLEVGETFCSGDRRGHRGLQQEVKNRLLSAVETLDVEIRGPTDHIGGGS